MDVAAVEARPGHLRAFGERTEQPLEPVVVEGEGVDVEGDDELGLGQQHAEVHRQLVADVDRQQQAASTSRVLPGPPARLSDEPLSTAMILVPAGLRRRTTSISTSRWGQEFQLTVTTVVAPGASRSRRRRARARSSGTPRRQPRPRATCWITPRCRQSGLRGLQLRPQAVPLLGVAMGDRPVDSRRQRRGPALRSARA